MSKLSSAKEGIEIIEEALIPTPTGKLKLDLVVVNQGRVHVVDVKSATRTPVILM
jgi:hypothetical protein